MEQILRDLADQARTVAAQLEGQRPQPPTRGKGAVTWPSDLIDTGKRLDRIVALSHELAETIEDHLRTLG
jgi:hypothetical protein